MPGTAQNGPCNVPLTQVDGSGNNTYAAPITQGAQYKSITEQLLYEIMEGINTLIQIQGGLPVTKIITFTIGDGQADTPAAGGSSLVAAAIQAQSITDKNLLVIRNGIELKYSSAVTHNDIIRVNNTGVSGGFEFDAAGSNLKFQNGDVYDIYVVGVNTTQVP